MKKRLCGILLVLAMILCQMPQAALAAEAGASAEPAVAAAEDEAAEEPAVEAGELTVADAEAATTEAAITEAATTEAVITEAAAEEEIAEAAEITEEADEAEKESPAQNASDTPGENVIDSVSVSITPPPAGTISVDAKASVSTSTPGLMVEYATWKDFKGYSTADFDTITLTGGSSCLVVIALVATDGSTFAMGESIPGLDIDACDCDFGGTCTVEGGTLDTAHFRSSARYGTERMYIWAEVTVTGSAPETSFFGVLISDVEGSMNTGGSYYMDYPGMEGDSSRTSSSNNFVEDGAGVYLEAYPADGYKFVGWYQGDPDRAEGKLYVGEPLTTDRTYQFDAPISLTRPYICAVFDVDDSPQGDQVMMWVGNTEVIGPNSAAQGGKVAVKYTPSYDVYPESITAKDGTDFVAGEILQFYKGDECTVYPKPDRGYTFIGWYHVNIEWAPGENLAWEGDVISTESSFTYKPGVTVVPGDTEPLRYVCAVFEKSSLSFLAHAWDKDGQQPGGGTVTFTNESMGGKTPVDRTSFTIVRPGATVTAVAAPAEGYAFIGWAETDGSSFAAAAEKIVATTLEYSFTAKSSLPPQLLAVFVPEGEKPARKVTVTTDGNGTASASAASGVSGTEVTLTAKPAAGYRLYKWEVISGGVSVKNNAFTIGDKDVEIKALFGKIPGKSEKVTVYNVAQGIKVTWLKVPDATSYYIYRDNLDGKGYKFLFRTSALEVTDKEVRYELGKKFRYKVLATSKYGGDAEGFRTSTYYRLMPTGITSVTNSGAGKMTVTYDKSSGGSGYVVRYGLKQDMSDAKVITVKGENTTSRTFSGLKKGQTYYVQARTYKIEDGIRYYSGYCLTKKVKIVK